MSVAPASLLTIDRLRVEFNLPSGRVVGVKEASIRVAPGEIVGLVGETGSGKSLMCRSVMRLVPPPGRIVAGQVEFDGRDVLAMSARELRHISDQLLALDRGTIVKPLTWMNDSGLAVLFGQRIVPPTRAGPRAEQPPGVGANHLAG